MTALGFADVLLDELLQVLSLYKSQHKFQFQQTDTDNPNVLN